MATTLNSPVFGLSWTFFEGRNPFCIFVGDGIGSPHYSPLHHVRLFGVDWQNKKQWPFWKEGLYPPSNSSTWCAQPHLVNWKGDGMGWVYISEWCSVYILPHDLMDKTYRLDGHVFLRLSPADQLVPHPEIEPHCHRPNNTQWKRGWWERWCCRCCRCRCCGGGGGGGWWCCCCCWCCCCWWWWWWCWWWCPCWFVFPVWLAGDKRRLKLNRAEFRVRDTRSLYLGWWFVGQFPKQQPVIDLINDDLYRWEYDGIRLLVSGFVRVDEIVGGC